MNALRRWQIDSASPFSLQLAADARISQTDYYDDQSWEILLGEGDSPALALQTRYGGRAGLASFVPMWLHDGRVIYETLAYAKAPLITAFAPGYLRIQATLSLQLALQAEYWVMDSHAIGCQFTIANAHTAPVDIRLDLLGFVGISGKEQKLSHIAEQPNGHALSLGKVGNLYPVVVLEDSSPQPDTGSSSHKIGRSVTISGRKKATFRMVHAALPDARSSLALAQKWLQQDWGTALQQIEATAQAIPQIETGNVDWDITIASAYQQLVQAFLKPTANLPHSSFVTIRQPSRGFNPHGGENDRAWNGQAPTQAYLSALGMASVSPMLAQGIVRNYLAVQQPDGWIDWKPGLGGQRQGNLCLPILARLTWGIFQYTEDVMFLRDTFPGLLKFFDRWFQPDIDADNDGIPEWQSENQTGYVFTPTFATWQGWGQGADIRRVEAPDLLAYLLSEAKSLREIAYYLRETDAEERLEKHITALQEALERFWNADEKRYSYRDYQTHSATPSISIIEKAHGNDEMIPALNLTPANRLVIRVSGGMDLIPRMTAQLTGFAENGQPVVEHISSEQFIWSHGRGVYTSRSVFSQIDRIAFEGLSRVYRVDVSTPDLSRSDIHGLLPLWSAGIPQERAVDLLTTVTDPHQFWRHTGISMNSAKDQNFDPSNANGSGGVWPFWLTLLGEGMIEYDAPASAYELMKKLLNAQVDALRKNKVFSEYYHSDEAVGLGENGHIGGLVPLHLLLRVLGVRVISHAKVWTGGPFVWEQPVTIQQHGVTVRRTSQSTQITFPSGHQVETTGEAWQEVIDPKPLQPPANAPTPPSFDELEPEHD